MLDDAADLSRFISEDAAVAGGIRKPSRQKRDVGAAVPMTVHQGLDRFRA